VKLGKRSHAERFDTDPSYRAQMLGQTPPVPRVAYHEEHRPHDRSPMSGKPTGRIVCYEKEVPYLDEKGWAADGPDRDEDWVESGALAVTERLVQLSSVADSAAGESSDD